MADASSGPNPPVRVITWAMFRSLSTVFEKCLSFVDGIQIINEPYQCAATLGPDGFMRASKITESQDKARKVLTGVAGQMQQMEGGGTGWDDQYCTYEWVKKTLETDYPGKKIVFCKDLISGIHGKYEYLPKGYRHTFIIRNPVKVGLSLRNGLKVLMPLGSPPEQLDITEFPVIKMFPGLCFGEILELMDHLKKTGALEGEPIIIDADDLQNHPDSIVSQYCQKTGIPYSKNLLTWEAGDGIVKRNWIISKGFLQGNKIMNYFDAAFASTGFQPTKGLPAPLPPDVVKFAQMTEPHYRKMYEMRIKP